MTGASEDRLRMAEAYLQEAVYRSRAVQAGAGLLAAGAAPASCGLGASPSVALGLSPRGAELFAGLWPDGLDADALACVRAATAVWVRKQDALDRKRNHFLKDFRTRHGFDRARYGEEEERAYRAGLDTVNAEIDAARREAAGALLAAAG